MTEFVNLINHALTQWISRTYPDVEIGASISISRGASTDYQFTQLRVLSKQLQTPIAQIASQITAVLTANPLVSDVKFIATPRQDLIVFNASSSHLQSVINLSYEKFVQNKNLAKPDAVVPDRVLIDFSSPNIAKEMHVGHLRSTIIGESLCRISELAGSTVIRINHVGDYGTQFGMLIAYIKSNNIDSLRASDLTSLYKSARLEFETDIEFNAQSHRETVALQSGDDTNIAIWLNLCEISMTSFNKIYQQLDTNARVVGESTYQPYMSQLVSDIADRLVEDNGAKLYWVADHNQPLMLVKSDGAYTYDTSDLAALRYRVDVEKADLMLYVVDNGQSSHFDLVFGAGIELGWIRPDQARHVGFGLVLGSDGKKIKSRSGQTTRLTDLIAEAESHALSVTTTMAIERHPDWSETEIREVSNKIAINCIKYTDLSNPRTTNYKYDIKRMTSMKGNTAVYLMYAVARCRAILRKINNLDAVINGEIVIEDASGRDLVFQLTQRDIVIRQSIDNCAPHFICNYLRDVVKATTRFYDANRCIEFDTDGVVTKVHDSRIRLVYFAVNVIGELFDLIGLKTVDEI